LVRFLDPILRLFDFLLLWDCPPSLAFSEVARTAEYDIPPVQIPEPSKVPMTDAFEVEIPEPTEVPMTDAPPSESPEPTVPMTAAVAPPVEIPEPTEAPMTDGRRNI